MILILIVRSNHLISESSLFPVKSLKMISDSSYGSISASFVTNLKGEEGEGELW